ncbi:MAG: SulP family inorganic anion transporter, partial [Clostridia bacterium]|nr:SulP family inorganic anion transporter [Deltaproteobacteria bacterium]
MSSVTSENVRISDIKTRPRFEPAGDLPAALVVFFVALPLCLGIALASGAPLLSGVVSGIVGGLVVGALSGAELSVSGPSAAAIGIVVLGTQQLGGFSGFLVAVVLAGVLQVIAGALKAGVIADFFPSAVIRGMLGAVGLILVLKQIPHAFGWDADFEGDVSFEQLDGRTTFTELGEFLDHVNWGATTIALVA